MSAVIASLGFGGGVLCPKAEHENNATSKANKKIRNDIMLLNSYRAIQA
ncbi:MAG: hypothetical protein ABJC05_10435 [Pyrinomonadaceae bacterium]